jgi:hypothetical protein
LERAGRAVAATALFVREPGNTPALRAAQSGVAAAALPPGPPTSFRYLRLICGKICFL